LYNVKKYTAAQARQRLSEVLDEAESKQNVVIERRGVGFSVKVEPKVRTRKAKSHIAFVDPSVEAGEWTWQWTASGLELAAHARNRRRRDPAGH
jgi:hypothetical protein